MKPENKIITKRADGSVRVQSRPMGTSRAQQQFKDQCDVNNIIAKFRKTGSITHLRNAQQGVYADLTELPDLREAQDTLRKATQAFETVPAQVRQRFGHDPEAFIKFLQDPKNDEEAIRLGLKVKKPEPTPDPVLQELQNLNKNLKSKSKTESSNPKND